MQSSSSLKHTRKLIEDVSDSQFVAQACTLTLSTQQAGFNSYVKCQELFLGSRLAAEAGQESHSCAAMSTAIYYMHMHVLMIEYRRVLWNIGVINAAHKHSLQSGTLSRLSFRNRSKGGETVFFLERGRGKG